MAFSVTKEKVLEENRRVHALENRLYLSRHPEQTNFFQNSILERAVNEVCATLKPGSGILDGIFIPGIPLDRFGFVAGNDSSV